MVYFSYTFRSAGAGERERRRDMARYGEERGVGRKGIGGKEVGNPVEGIKGIYKKEGKVRVVPRTKNPWKSGGKK